MCQSSPTRGILYNDWLAYKTIRLATQKEVDLLIGELRGHGKDWDKENKRIVEYRIPPKWGAEFNIVKMPFNMSFFSPVTGMKLGELREKGGKLIFEGDVDSSARIFFEEIIKVYNK